MVQFKRLTLDAVLQRLPFQQLHGDEGLTLVLPYIVNDTNVRMVQRGCGAGLALEAIDRIFVREQYLRQELERNAPVEPRVHRFVDYSHAPAAQQRFDLVMTYLPPGERVLLLYGNNSGCGLRSRGGQRVTSLPVRLQECLDFPAEVFIPGRRLYEKGFPTSPFSLEGSMVELVDPLPPFAIHKF